MVASVIATSNRETVDVDQRKIEGNQKGQDLHGDQSRGGAAVKVNFGNLFWDAVAISTFFGFGWLIWWCSVGFSTLQRVLFVIGAYVLVAVVGYAVSFPCAGSIPTKSSGRDK